MLYVPCLFPSEWRGGGDFAPLVLLAQSNIDAIRAFVVSHGWRTLWGVMDGD